MTKPLREAVKIIIEELKVKGKVLEVGSRQEKNQKQLANLRDYFKEVEFTGIDMRKGPGVDRVANAEKLPFADNYFDLVLCLETLEHSRLPFVVSEELMRVVKRSGVIIASSQQNFPLHKHPSDYFRYTPYGLKQLFNRLKNQLVFSISPPYGGEVKLNPQHVILLGSKVDKGEVFRRIRKQLRKNVASISGHKPYRHRLEDALKWIRRGLNEWNFRWEVEFFD